MNIKKILKVYLAFILLGTSMSIVANATQFKGYIAPYWASVLNAPVMEVKPYEKVYDLENFVKDKQSSFLMKNQNPNLINFSIVNNPANAYAKASSKGAE